MSRWFLQVTCHHPTARRWRPDQADFVVEPDASAASAVGRIEIAVRSLLVKEGSVSEIADLITDAGPLTIAGLPGTGARLRTAVQALFPLTAARALSISGTGAAQLPAGYDLQAAARCVPDRDAPRRCR
jgi:hypothetical protein